MEVLLGSIFGIDASSPTAYARDHGGDGNGFASLCRFIKEHTPPSVDDDSSDSSSIGAESEEGEEDDEENDVFSSERALGSLSSLEDSLPMKKGLSSYYSGKSRSFADLSQLDSISSSAKDLGKPENPFNKKRRRIQMANKWSSSSRRSSSSLYAWQNSVSVPLLALNEEGNVGDEAEESKQQTQK